MSHLHVTSKGLPTHCSPFDPPPNTLCLRSFDPGGCSFARSGPTYEPKSVAPNEILNWIDQRQDGGTDVIALTGFVSSLIVPRRLAALQKLIGLK